MWKGARYKYWAWLIVAVFMLLISRAGYAQVVNGLNYQTYIPNGSFVSPNRNTLTPLTSGTVPNLYNDWDYVLNSGRNERVVVKFTGYFKASTAGTYTFGLEGDDGVELIMKGTTVISYWADQPGTFRNGTITLAQDEVVPITVWYYENSGGARLRFTQLVNGTYTAVPTTSLATSFELWCNPCSPSAGNSNLGFESGTTTNWSISNGTGTNKTSGWGADGIGVETTTGMTSYQPGGGKTWTVRPYGNYMMVIQAGGGSPTFDTSASSLGLTSTEINAIKTYLQGLGGNSNPTNASWAKRTVSLKAGVTYTIAWQYMSTDYVPFNDGSMMTLTHASDATKIPTLNNTQARYALLGFTNPGTGNYATDSYGSTGWQLATITVPVDGDYILGFASFNLGDTALSPILFVDDLQGQTELNGQAFGPIAPNSGSTAPVTGGGGGAPSWPTSDGPTTNQINQKNAAKNRVANITLGNHLYLEEKIGSSSNTVNIEQSGSYNKISGLVGTTYSIIDGDNNNINIKQGSVLGKNLTEFSVTGNSNSVTIWQARNESTGLGNASDSGGHYTGLTVNGSSNTLTVKQSNSGGTGSGHLAFVDVSGNNNQGLLKQNSNGEKLFFGILTGNYNIFDVTQQGTGNHFLDLTLTGNSNNATVNQKDAGGHKATVNLTNAGGAATLNLIQQGNTAQSINITQQCATLSGCSVTVTQGTGP